MLSLLSNAPCARALITAIAIEALFVSTVVAQSPTFQPPPAPVSAVGAPVPASGAPGVFPPPGGGTNPAPISAADGDELVKLQLPNFDVRDVLSYYERLTGKRLVIDNTIQGQVNIVVNTDIRKSEAIKIIETALLLNGFSIVPGDGITKVLGLSKNARGAGVSIYSDFSSLPEGELVVSYLFRLRYLDPTELQQILQQYVTANLYTSFVALPKSGALLVTESTSVLRKLVQLVREVDLPPADVVQEFIALQRAEATKAVEFLNSVFEKKESTTGGAGRPGGVRPRLAPGVPPPPGVPNVAVPAVLDTSGAFSAATSLTEDAIIVGKISLTADVRTNRIHVVTRPVNMPFVRRLLAEYDANTPFADPVKRRLNNVSARDVLPILVASLTEPGGDGSGAGAAAAGGARPAGATGTPANSLFPNRSTSPNSSGSGSGTGSGGLNLTQGLETQPVDTTPTIATVGNTKIIADSRDNAIIIQGSDEARDRVFKILDQLDVEAPQVAIYAIIGELSLGDGIQSGIDYILNRANGVTAGSNFTGLVSGTAFDRGNPPVGTPVSSVANLAGTLLSGFNGAGAIIRATDRFDVIIRALESSNRFKTISRPMIFTSNNKKAVIASGQEIAVPTNTLSNSTIGSTGATNNTAAVQSSIQFKSVTLQLEVVPLINSKNKVTLDILQKIDSVVSGGGTVIAGTTVPTIATRYVKSSVSVPNQGTVVLGGLIQQDESKTKTGLPFLSNIPILGKLFSSRQNTNSRRELIILIRPVVTSTIPQLAKNRADNERKYYLKGDLEAQLDPYYESPESTVQPVRRAQALPPPRNRVLLTPVEKKKPTPPVKRKPDGKKLQDET